MSKLGTKNVSQCLADSKHSDQTAHQSRSCSYKYNVDPSALYGASPDSDKWLQDRSESLLVIRLIEME